jgi:hypothetical protein
MDIDFSYRLLSRVPLILLVVAGILLAIVRWKRHSKVSLLTVLGLGLFLFQSLTFMFLYTFLPRLLERGWTFTSINLLYTATQLCQDFLFAGAIILLVVAAFSQRQPQLASVDTKSAIPT